VAPISHVPPPVGEAEFLAVDILNKEEIKRRFGVFVGQLHSYLNQLPCLRDVPQIRRLWKPRAPGTEAFGNIAANPSECYTFNCGGRREAQFNVGVLSTHVRVGLGFEFTPREGGDRTIVGLAYTCFVNVIKTNRTQFERFVADNHLEIEWSNNTDGPLQFIPTSGVVPWLLNPLREPVWIFVGRLLRRTQDAPTLEDPNALGSVMQAVLCGFRPIWEQTQMMANASSRS
jgi:hypothetical protein